MPSTLTLSPFRGTSDSGPYDASARARGYWNRPPQGTSIVDCGLRIASLFAPTGQHVNSPIRADRRWVGYRTARTFKRVGGQVWLAVDGWPLDGDSRFPRLTCRSE